MLTFLITEVICVWCRFQKNSKIKKIKITYIPLPEISDTIGIPYVVLKVGSMTDMEDRHLFIQYRVEDLEKAITQEKRLLESIL